MKKNIIIFILLTFLSRLVLSLSGTAETPISDVLYVLAFALPILIGTPLADRDRARREEIAGVREKSMHLFSLRKESAALAAPLVFISVAVIFFVAYLGYIMISLMGGEPSGDISGSFFELILTSALLPTLTEEMLFRFLPMKLILPYSRKWTVILSAVSFSAFHLNYEQYFYAFAAGLIFILADIAFESVLPSMVMHFVNNILSVVWMKIGGEETYSLIFVLSLASLALISTAFIIVFRKKYTVLIHRTFGEKEGNSHAVR